MINFTLLYNIKILLKRNDLFVFMKKIYSSTFVQTQIDTLTLDQLYLLFNVYRQLTYYNFFMSETKYLEFLNFYYNTSSKYNIDTYKSLIKILTTSYTSPDKYFHVINSIEMIKQDLPLVNIINTLYSNR